MPGVELGATTGVGVAVGAGVAPEPVPAYDAIVPICAGVKTVPAKTAASSNVAFVGKYLLPPPKTIGLPEGKYVPPMVADAHFGVALFPTHSVAPFVDALYVSVTFSGVLSGRGTP